MPSSSPWDGLSERELDLVCDLLYTLRQPSRHYVLTENFCIAMAGPMPDAEPVEKADLVGASGGISRTQRPTGSTRRRSTGSSRFGAILDWTSTYPLPTFEEVAP